MRLHGRALMYALHHNKMAEQVICIPDETEETGGAGLLDQFSSITGVGEDLAKSYLELGDWNIQLALNHFYEAQRSTQSVLAQCSGTGDSGSPLLIPDDEPLFADEVTDKHSVEKASAITCPTTVPPLKLISWNIDGLDERNILERIRAVCDMINERRPDVVFLQEVTPQSLPVLQSKCSSSYLCQIGSIQEYFNMMLLRKTTVKPTDSLDFSHFASSNMGRHLLIQPITFHHNTRIVLMTSHLESTANCARERMNQFKHVLGKMQEQSPEVNVIFGGDTNLRDHEVASVGGLPRGIVDVWQACDSPRDTQFTWDVSKNDNLDWQSKSKPKLRFDRLFLRPTQQGTDLTPLHIAFIGTDRLPGCQRFPSDHWGLWTELQSSSQ